MGDDFGASFAISREKKVVFGQTTLASLCWPTLSGVLTIDTIAIFIFSVTNVLHIIWNVRSHQST